LPPRHYRPGHVETAGHATQHGGPPHRGARSGEVAVTRGRHESSLTSIRACVGTAKFNVVATYPSINPKWRNTECADDVTQPLPPSLCASGPPEQVLRRRPHPRYLRHRADSTTRRSHHDQRPTGTNPQRRPHPTTSATEPTPTTRRSHHDQRPTGTNRSAATPAFAQPGQAPHRDGEITTDGVSVSTGTALPPNRSLSRWPLIRIGGR
jgi:hypothetical protein